MSTDSFKEKLGKSLFIIQCINCKANENRHLKITHDSDQKCCQQGVVKKVFTGRLFSEIRQSVTSHHYDSISIVNVLIVITVFPSYCKEPIGHCVSSCVIALVALCIISLVTMSAGFSYFVTFSLVTKSLLFICSVIDATYKI